MCMAPLLASPAINGMLSVTVYVLKPGEMAPSLSLQVGCKPKGSSVNRGLILFAWQGTPTSFGFPLNTQDTKHVVPTHHKLTKKKQTHSSNSPKQTQTDTHPLQLLPKPMRELDPCGFAQLAPETSESLEPEAQADRMLRRLYMG